MRRAKGEPGAVFLFFYQRIGRRGEVKAKKACSGFQEVAEKGAYLEFLRRARLK
jgi:hypothetical protein